MTEKLVSIIVPAFNAERYIGKTLASVRSQSYQNWEVIVTDDCSTDGTSQIVAEFTRSTSHNVRLFQHAQNCGVPTARNTAMKAAQGEYIAFLDADDIWMPEHLDSLCSVLNSGRADLAYSDGCVFRETPSGDTELLPIDTIEVTNPPQDLFRRCFINPSGAAITRRLMEKVGYFDQALRVSQDADYWIRAAALGFQIAGTGKETYYYRKLAGSLSAAPARKAEYGGRVLEKHRHCGILPESEIVAKARGHYFAAGKLYWRQDAATASRMFFKSWTLCKIRVMPLLCAFGAAGLSLLQTSHRKERTAN
jgi:glycosyltransferase involved in cell wall biosynthesis